MIRLIILYSFLFISPIALRNVKPLRALEPSEDYTHMLVVDDDTPEQYQLFWKLIGVNDEIQFEVHCKTTGWVGIGLSPNGGMPGADIAIGWVKDGKAHLKDCYADDKTTPRIDAQQDYILLEGAEHNGYTILKYKRKLVTCDDGLFDKEIKIGTQYLIFAWNDEDPATGNIDWVYHGVSNRMQRTALLLSFKDESLDDQSILPSDTFTHSLRMNNLKVPAKETYYFCDVYQLPSFEKPVHMFQFEILINKNTKKHFHHVLAYECDYDFVLDAPVAQECGSVPLPIYIKKKCFQKIMVAWGIGGQLNYTFPKQAGYRIDPSTRPKYVLIEAHYDNPTLKEDIIDDSGVKLYFTEQLKQHDLGVLLLGNDGFGLALQIPPRSKHSTYTTICHPECTQNFFPDDGIYAVSAFLHTHLAGRSVKTTLVRNDEAILELVDNPTYDFNYQFLIDLEPVKLQKGDALITQCSFDTTDRDNFTFYGFGTHEEMCYDFIFYYPKIPNLITCMTLTNAKAIYDFYRSLMKESLIPEIELKEEDFLKTQDEIMDFFHKHVNATPLLTKRFEDFYASSYNKTTFCGGPFGELIHKENVLHYAPKSNSIKKIDKCKSSSSSSQKVNSSLFILIITSCLKLIHHISGV